MSRTRAKRKATRVSAGAPLGHDLADEDRVALIRKAFAFCGVTPTQAEIAKQFRHETGRDMTKRRRSRHTRVALPSGTDEPTKQDDEQRLD